MTSLAMQGNYGQNLNPSISRVEDSSVLAQLNFIIQSICNCVYINPYTCIQRIKNQLVRVGVTFDTPLLFGDEGGISISVEQFPVYGQDLHGHIGNSDLGKDKVIGGLVIRFNWIKVKGLYTIECELKRRMDSTLPIITEPIVEKWTFAGMLRKERARVRTHRIGKSYKRKYTKHKYGVSTSKGFSHKKFNSRTKKAPKARFN